MVIISIHFFPFEYSIPATLENFSPSQTSNTFLWLYLHHLLSRSRPWGCEFLQGATGAVHPSYSERPGHLLQCSCHFIALHHEWTGSRLSACGTTGQDLLSHNLISQYLICRPVAFFLLPARNQSGEAGFFQWAEQTASCWILGSMVGMSFALPKSSWSFPA